MWNFYLYLFIPYKNIMTTTMMILSTESVSKISCCLLAHVYLVRLGISWLSLCFYLPQIVKSFEKKLKNDKRRIKSIKIVRAWSINIVPIEMNFKGKQKNISYSATELKSFAGIFKTEGKGRRRSRFLFILSAGFFFLHVAFSF